MPDRDRPGAKLVVLLADGRQVVVWEYGDPTGPAVVAHHGTPASGTSFAGWHEPAADLGVRVLAPDRPGVGESTRRPGYRVRHIADDTAEILDRLDVDGFAVVGWSGGGPYALACADLLDDRVRRYGLVASMGPLSWPEGQQLEALDRWSFRLVGVAPVVVAGGITLLARLLTHLPRRAMESFLARMPEADRAAVEAVGMENMGDMLAAYRRSGAGAADDYAAQGADWFLDLPSIHVPGRAWHGTADTVVAPAVSRRYAEIIPGLDLVEYPDEGHLIGLTHAHDILAYLAATDAG